MSTEMIETAARAAYVEVEWAGRITEHDSDRRTDAEYKERAGTHWDDGHAGYSMYRRYRRQAAAVIAAIHPTVSTGYEADQLPVGSVVLDGDGMAAQNEGDAHWDGGGRCWGTRQLALPATVLHMGGAA